MNFEEGKLQVIRPFPTFMVGYQFPDVAEFNRDLTLELYKMRARDGEGIYRSNSAGCWHSQDKVIQEAGAPGEKLGQMFFQVFSALADCHGGQKGGKYEMKLSAWAMMYKDGGYATPHTHPNCHFSGVYYPCSGATEQKTMATGVKVRPGCLEFLDIRGGPGTQQIPGLAMNPSLRIDPVAGFMVVFPCWLPHFVHPVTGGTDRLAVACNATISKYTLPPEKEEINDIDQEHPTGHGLSAGGSP